MKPALGEIWVYLSASPLLHLTLTLCAYLLGDWLFRRSGRKALFNPVLLAVLTLVALLAFTDTPYPTYFAGAQFVHFLLGPATVALAVPLYFNFSKLRSLWMPLSLGLLAGSATAALSSVGIAHSDCHDHCSRSSNSWSVRVVRSTSKWARVFLGS